MASNPARRCLVVLATALCAGGCVTSQHADVIGRAADIGPDAEIEFLTGLNRVARVSDADAVYAMTLLAAHQDGSPDGGDYDRRVSALKASDRLPRDFSGRPDTAVDRGTLAHFVAVAVHLPRGLTSRIVGLSGRYALREVEFRGLFPPSSPNQTISGPELIGILDRAAAYSNATRPDRQSGNAPPPMAEVGPLLGVQLASRTLDAMMVDLADAPAPPASAPGQYVFTEVVGGVYVLPGGGDKRVRVKVGVAVDDATRIQTAINATAKLVGPNGEQITLDPFTDASIRTFTAADGTHATRVLLDHGTGAAKIDTTLEAPDAKFDLRLESPRATLAIRGTQVALYDQLPFDVEARSLTGTAVFEQFQRQKVAFGRKNGGVVSVTGQRPDPTSVALNAATEDPGARNARSESEADVIANYFSRSSPIRIDRLTDLPTVFGGKVPTLDADFRPFLTGGLNLAITWTAPTDLNLQVFILSKTDPITGTITPSRIIYPYGSLARDAQGRLLIPFDNRGGKHGGFEIVHVPDAATMTTYRFSAQNVDNVPTKFKVWAFGDEPLVLSNRNGQTGKTATNSYVGGSTATLPFFVDYDQPPKLASDAVAKREPAIGIASSPAAKGVVSSPPAAPRKAAR